MKYSQEDLKVIGEQIENVRQTGRTNMLDRVHVVEIAGDEGYDELYEYVYDNRDRWLSAMLEAREAAGYGEGSD